MKIKNIFLAFIFASLFLFQPALKADLKTGEPAPDFSLTGTDGKTHTLSESNGKFRVLEWNNPDCPFVVKHYASGNMQALQKKYTDAGVVWLTINSSALGKQGHYPAEKWQQILTQEKAAPTAALLDGDGTVGKLYGAKTTPHMYVIDPAGNLIYQGAIDSVASTDQADIAQSTNYVSTTLDEAMAGKPVSNPSTKAYGCSVKY